MLNSQWDLNVCCSFLFSLLYEQWNTVENENSILIKISHSYLDSKSVFFLFSFYSLVMWSVIEITHHSFQTQLAPTPTTPIIIMIIIIHFFYLFSTLFSLFWIFLTSMATQWGFFFFRSLSLYASVRFGAYLFPVSLQSQQFNQSNTIDYYYHMVLKMI